MAVDSDIQAITTTFSVVLSIALLTTAFVVVAWAAFSWRSQRDLLRVVRDQCDRVAHMRYQGFRELAGAGEAPPAADWQDLEETRARHAEMETRHAHRARGDVDPSMPPEVTG